MQGFGQKRVRGLLPKTGNPKVLRCARRTLERRFSRGPALPPAPRWEVTGGWGVTPPRSGSGLLLLCATLPVINSPDFRMSLSSSHNCAPDSMKWPLSPITQNTSLCGLDRVQGTHKDAFLWICVLGVDGSGLYSFLFLQRYFITVKFHFMTLAQVRKICHLSVTHFPCMAPGFSPPPEDCAVFFDTRLTQTQLHNDLRRNR